MRLPIALALGWPQRVIGPARACDWSTAATWEFFPLDHQAFPAVGLARAAGQRGGTFPAVFNAANEVAVHAFFQGNLRFTGIVDTVEEVLSGWADHPSSSVREEDLTIDDVMSAQTWAQERARGAA
jgi:1-deoxy-D-xylulose-5-phosphate reductoisomerase